MENTNEYKIPSATINPNSANTPIIAKYNEPIPNTTKLALKQEYIRVEIFD